MSENYRRLLIHEGCEIYCGDALEVLPRLHAQGLRAHLVLTDLPYGSTHCRWDTPLDLAAMWRALQGVAGRSTPILLFGQQPFTSVLGASNLAQLRYAWVWEKAQPTGFLNARRMPMKAHEDILVFYDRLPEYRPQKTQGHARKVTRAEHQRKCRAGDIYQPHDRFRDYDSTERFPRSVLRFKTDKQRVCLHAAQKPVALLEYLIRTYTDPGDTVLDFTMGSGSTGVACRNTNRRFVGIEVDDGIFRVAQQRLSDV